MGLPVIESSNTATGSAVSSITITKPTGLAVGDLMLALITNYDATANNRSHTTPGGWTSFLKQATGDFRPVAYYKVATSGDVAASNFTFSMSGSTTALCGYLARISGYYSTTPISIGEIDTNASPSGTTITFTTALTPAVINSRAFVMFAAATTNMTGSPATMSTYSTTPSISLTEVADLGIKDGSLDGQAFGIASGTYESLTQITSRSAVISEALTQGTSGIMLFVNGTNDASGTNALHSVSPTHFNQAGRGDTNGTSALLEVSPTHLSQTGKGTAPTQWTNESAEDTTWTNETI